MTEIKNGLCVNCDKETSNFCGECNAWACAPCHEQEIAVQYMDNVRANALTSRLERLESALRMIATVDCAVPGTLKIGDCAQCVTCIARVTLKED